ncbi:hypothetical protein CBER1_07503 [Cercospora berteroae]|uniref:Uncharacterized protein n=1 Tax=Cercospora berteroae TaxID=357750 RepID=A0A2S6BUP5_9PEZI|nr:hypothetical protein CBER1_07503 [Cercospora berteroae]
MSLKNDSPRSSQLSVPTTPSEKARRRSSAGIGENLSTHHIIANDKDDLSTLDIQLKGRIALVAKTIKPRIGSPSLHLTTPKVDGESIVATAKLQPNSGKCKVVLGEVNDEQKPDWTQIDRTHDSNRLFLFTHNKRRYIWRARVNTGLHDIHRSDLELVDQAYPDSILAIYLANRLAVSRNQIARLDFLADMGPDFEVLCLMSVLGTRQSSRMEAVFWGVTSKLRKRGRSSAGIGGSGFIAVAAAAGVGGGC